MAFDRGWRWKNDNGHICIIFSFIILEGIIMWWPKKGKTKKSFTVKWNAKLPRLNYDLHKVLGFYSFFILLFIALTGLYFSFGWYRNSAIWLLGSEVETKQVQSKTKQFLKRKIKIQTEEQPYLIADLL